MKPECQLGSILQKRVGQAWSSFREGSTWQVAGSQLHVNYHHLHLDQGLGCTGMAAGRVLGEETWLTFLLSPCTSAGGTAPNRGEQKGHPLPMLRPQQAGPVGAGFSFPRHQGHLLAAPKGLPRGRAAGHVRSNSDRVCVIISQGDFTGSPWLPLSVHEHPLLQKPHLVNIP